MKSREELDREAAEAYLQHEHLDEGNGDMDDTTRSFLAGIEFERSRSAGLVSALNDAIEAFEGFYSEEDTVPDWYLNAKLVAKSYLGESSEGEGGR